MKVFLQNKYEFFSKNFFHHKEKFLYIGSELFLKAISFITGVFIAKKLGVYNMGLYNSIQIIPGYGMILGMGIINGMGVKVPYYLGKIENERVKSIISSTSSFVFFFIGILYLVAFCVFFWSGGLNSEELRIFFYGILLLSSVMVFGFSNILIRSFQDFRNLAYHKIFKMLIYFLIIPILNFFPNLGIVIFLILVSDLVASFRIKKYLPTNFKFQVEKKILKELFKVGFPLFLAGFSYSLFLSTDRLLIIYFYSVELLGKYTPAIIIINVVSMLPTYIASIAFPKMAKTYGQTNENPDKLVPILKKVIKINFVTTISMGIFLFIIFYFLVIPYYLTDYLEGRVPMSINLLATFILPFAFGYGGFFSIIGYGKVYMKNIILGFLGNLFSGLILLGVYDFGLNGVAISTLIGYFIFAVSQNVFYFKLKRNGWKKSP